MIPLTFNLRGKRVLVLGAGAIGAGKARLLAGAGAELTVLSEEIRSPLPPEANVVLRRYQAGDLAGFHLVVSATGDATVNDQVVREANERGIWLNCVDDPARCDFFFNALHRDGDVIVAISSQGAAPALAQFVRDRIREVLPSRLGQIAATLRQERDLLHEQGLSTEGRDWRPRIQELFNEQPS